MQFLIDKHKLESIDPSVINFDKKWECIFYDSITGKSRAAYCIPVSIYEVIVDIATAKVLSVSQTLFEEENATGYVATDINKLNGFPIAKLGEGYYILHDVSRAMTVFTFNGRTSYDPDKKFFFKERASVVESIDTIFGNTEEEKQLEYELGVKLLRNTSLAYDFFNSLGFDANGSKIMLYYNDGYLYGRQALGGIDADGDGIICMGSERGVECRDIIAHEYTHFVSRSLVGWEGTNENGALNEALSDIFGELIEASILNSKPDWYISSRFIANPLASSYPERYKGVNWKSVKKPSADNDWGYVHKNSTVISHAAYLMWNGINGNENKKISEDKLAKIWYRAMLMMPADCDFATCRQMVEWAALAVNGLTDAQRKCVGEAFDQVGIYDQKANSGLLLNCDYNVKPESALNVYDVDGELFAPYKLEIVGTYAEHELAYATNIISDAGMKYEKTEIILSPKTCYLDLPDGYYTFRITAANNPNVEYEFTVSVSDQGTEECVDFYSEFRNQLIVPITSPKQDEEKKTENEEVSNLKTLEARISIRLGLHCEWAVIGDFDGDRAEEIYAITCFSSTDYSNAQVWYLSGAENKCILWLSEEEAELICRIVPLLPDWLTGRIIVSIDEIDDFVSDIKRKYF